MDAQTKNAIEYVHKNLAVIGCAARMQNEYALEVQAAYAQLCQHPHEVAKELLVNAVESWKAYHAENPQAEV